MSSLCSTKSRGYSTFAEASKFANGVEPATFLTPDSIPYNPVFFSYAVVTPTAATLYVDESKLPQEVRDHLGDKVEIRPYEAIFGDVAALSKASLEAKDEAEAKKKFLTSNRASWALNKSLGGEEKVEEAAKA